MFDLLTYFYFTNKAALEQGTFYTQLCSWERGTIPLMFYLTLS